MLKFNKAPGEVLDFAIDWSTQLDGDEIVTSKWIVPSGLTKVRDSLHGAVATIWLSGGAINNRFTVLNRVTTTAGRTLERVVRVVIGFK